MNYLEIALVIILAFLVYDVYKAVEKMTEAHNNLGDQIKESLDNIKSSVTSLAWTLNGTLEGTEVLDSFLKIPVDKEELDKKKETLIKYYANYLFHNKDILENDLSYKNALLQANFEVERFGVSEVMREIKWDEALRSYDVEKEFVNSDFFLNQINNFWTVGLDNKKIVLPIDLFRPIYEFMKENDYKDGEIVVLNKRKDSSYYSYIKNRAILFNLKKLGIIKFLENENRVDLSESPFRFISNDANVIKKTINKGYSDFPGYFLSEDNKDYDDYLSEHQSSEELFIKIKI